MLKKNDLYFYFVVIFNSVRQRINHSLIRYFLFPSFVGLSELRFVTMRADCSRIASVKLFFVSLLERDKNLFLSVFVYVHDALSCLYDLTK